MHICMYACMYTYICGYVCIYIYIYAVHNATISIQAIICNGNANNADDAYDDNATNA